MFVHSFGWGALRRNNADLVPIWEQISSGVAAAWRSDLGITLNGSNVSAWASQAGSVGGSVVQENASLQPAYISNDSNWGGLPSIHCSAANQILVSNLAASDWNFLHNGSSYSFLSVVRPEMESGICRLWQTRVSDSQPGAKLLHVPANNRFAFRAANDTTLIFNVAVGSAAPEKSNYAVFGTFATPGSGDDAFLYYPPATLIGSDNSGTPTTSDCNDFVIDSGNGDAYHLEYVFWTRVLTPEEQAIVSAYTLARYGGD